MIARIKGLKISQASERTAVTGQEMIPFQDGERNGKIRMIEFKDMTMYIFDPTIVDSKVSQEDYDALKQAIEEGKLIYTINSNRNGLDLATEVAIVGGTIYIESPDFIKEEGTDNISQVVFDTITVDGSLNYSKEQYTTTVIKTTGDGTKVLTDNGQYVYIGNLALTNIKFKDGTNTSTYDLVTNGITFRQNSTPCVSWNTIKSGNNIYMDIRIANATASMDGLMSKEDYVELNTTSRSANVYFTQSESGKRDYATISQSGYVPPADNYVFTWEDGSTSDVSASFPWDFSTNGTAANIPVVSTKNGSSQSWSVSSKPSWITTSTTSSKVTISASDNSGSARSGKVVLTQSGSGNTLTVNVSQGAKPAENVYVFTITPNTYDAPYSSASFIPRTVSTKNGSNIGYSLTSGGTDWVVVSTTGKITVEILKNTTSNTRSTTLVFTQNESGKTQSIKITQSGYTPTYTFNVTPTNLSVTAAETNETLTVNSYKTVLKSDGSETTESLNYEFSSNASWVNAARTTTNTTYITVAQNLTTNQRSAKITLTQAESGAQVFTNVIQAGQQVVDNKLTLTSITYSTGYLFPSGQTPVEGETVYLGFVVPNTFTWKTSNGLAINRGTIYAGNIGNIYVRENDRYKLVKSFQLQTGDQTISF